MKQHQILAAALLAGFATFASAQGSGPDTASSGRYERPMPRNEARNNSGWDAPTGRDARRRDQRIRDEERRNHRYEPYYYNARHPDFRRGGYIPPQYRNQQYWVNDWNRHGLRRPPGGYRWVQVGADYVLIAIASGVIAELLLNQ